VVVEVVLEILVLTRMEVRVVPGAGRVLIREMEAKLLQTQKYHLGMPAVLREEALHKYVHRLVAAVPVDSEETLVKTYQEKAGLE